MRVDINIPKLSKDTVIQDKEGTLICTCCGASAKFGDKLEHDETCDWNNTREAVLDFIPQDFLLGVENLNTSEVQLSYEDYLGDDEFTYLLDLVDELCLGLTESDRAVALLELVNEVPELGADAVAKYIKHPAETGQEVTALGNYIVFAVASREQLEDAAAELNRAMARRETIHGLFREQLQAFDIKLPADI